MKKSIIFVLFCLFFISSPAFAGGIIDDGLYMVYTGNYGPLTHLAYYEDSRQDGCSFDYYDNGEIEEQSWYRNGELQGMAKYFDEDGQLRQLVTYIDGKVSSIKKYSESGNLISEKEF